MTDETERIRRDLIEVLIPRLTDAQIKRLHASAARMATTTAAKGDE